MLNLQADILAQVVARAKASAADRPRWLAAIERAARELESNPYIEALDDHTLLIGSPSGNSYVGNGSCQCTAFTHGQPCYHRAMARLYQRYVEAVAEQAKPSRTAPPMPTRPLSMFARQDAETARLAAKGEMRAQLEERRERRKAAAAQATASINELFN